MRGGGRERPGPPAPGSGCCISWGRHLRKGITTRRDRTSRPFRRGILMKKAALASELKRPAACQKTSVEGDLLKLGRGSSRGRQPASNGIECPECLAWQGVQRAQRGLFRRTAAGKYRHFCCLGRKTGRPGVPPLRKYKSLSGERRRGRRPRRPAGAHCAALRFKRIALIIRTVPLIRHAARATFP